MSPLEISKSRSQLIESILAKDWQVVLPHQLLEAVAAWKSDAPRDELNKAKARVQTKRESLSTLTDAELKHRYDKMLADDKASDVAAAAKTQAKQVAKAVAKEATRFYNQPNARPNFAHWCAMEYWTFDEAIALLLAMNPTVFTAAAVNRELSKSAAILLFPPPQPRPAFLTRYVDLCALAQRASVMSGSRLKPVAVVVWAEQTGTFTPPTELVELLKARLLAARALADKARVPVAVPVSAPPESKMQGDNVVSEFGTQTRWTVSRRAELEEFLKSHTIPQAAQHFGVSASRIGDVRRRGKKKMSEGNSVFNYHP